VISPPVRRVEFDPGRPRNWNRTVNRPLQPNTEYVQRGTGYRYRTDSRGRVTSISGNLVRGKGHRNEYQQRKAGRRDRRGTDQGGHLFAHIFKGPGERINLVPMDATLNTQQWKRMEYEWDKALRAGHQVRVEGTVRYAGDSSRPVGFDIRYTINNGRPIHRTFSN
jgi:hypothetical protein